MFPLIAQTDDDRLELQASYGDVEDQVTTELIAEKADDAAATFFSQMNRRQKAVFLRDFWREENPVVLKYYYAYHLGDRRFNVSNHFYNREKRFPEFFATEEDSIDTSVIVDALETFSTILRAHPNDKVILNALGYAMLERRDFKAAEDLFIKALQKDGRMAVARNGRGLAMVMRPNMADVALGIFREAAATDRDYAWAYHNVAVAHLLMRNNEVGRFFREACKRDANQVDSHYKLGCYYESDILLRKSQDLEKAAAAYRKQVNVNPGHRRAWIHLCSATARMGRTDEAIAIWDEATTLDPSLKESLLPYMMVTYLAIGDTRRAQETAEEHIDGLDETTKGYYRNIDLVASQEELDEFEGLMRFEKPAYRRRFWKRRDPTPATKENERVVEHYRRVLHAMREFSGDVKPWDKRGDIYIRYGDPAHVSSWDHVRPEFDPRVVAVKRRLMNQLPPSGLEEIAERMFQSGRFIRRGAAEHMMTDNNREELNLNEMEIERANGGVEFIDGLTAENIDVRGAFRYDPTIDRERALKGYPLYPVGNRQPWEYWIYPEVDGGIEIAFVSHNELGGYDYPNPPLDTDFRQKNAVLWVQRRPEHVVASAVKAQSDIFRVPAPIHFFTDYADFEGDGKNSRLEVYVEVPLNQLSARKGVGRIERGIAVFDENWVTKYERVDTIDYQPSEEIGSTAVSEFAVNIPPGSYIVGTQLKDPATGRYGSSLRRLDVTAYPFEELAMSDIQMAGEVYDDFVEAFKGGLGIIPRLSRLYGKEKPVMFYYEIYGLVKDDFGQRRYRVEYHIAPRTNQKPLVKVLRSVGKILGVEGEQTVTISTEQIGARPTENSYLEIDVSKSEPGDYDLSITVTDLVTEAQVSSDAWYTVADERKK